tara:strand:- start:3242 stop:3415 length:174 start_codon:yes stop_codon:yes gene_type:complete
VIIERVKSMNKVRKYASEAPEKPPQNPNIDLWKQQHREGPSSEENSTVKRSSESKSP